MDSFLTNQLQDLTLQGFKKPLSRVVATRSIGVVVSHMFMDAASLSFFFKHWAAITSNSSEPILYPDYSASSVFPQRDPFPIEAGVGAHLAPFVRVGKVGTRRFTFDEAAIRRLKAKSISSNVEDPTGVEVVTAHLLKCIMGVFRVLSGVHKPTLITHLVNLRRRALPPFSECSIGNFIWPAATVAKPEETNDLSSSVSLLRNAFRKVSNEFVKRAQGEDGFIKLYEEIKGIFTGNHMAYSSGVDLFVCTSWCNFGLYEVDFGWGKPVWTTWLNSFGSKTETPFLNSVVLMDARAKKGIEAWLILNEDELNLLEKDDVLRAYASLNPCPMPVEPIG